MNPPVRTGRSGALTWSIAALVGASIILLAACGSSGKTATAPPATSAGTTGGSIPTNASVTVSAANVPGLGTVLVNGDGRTLYILVGEKGGKISCTTAGSCTKFWPPAVLPSGMSQGIAGSGVQASLLGTVTGPAGDARVTYGGWPLYTFLGDSRSGVATGQGLKDSYGLWWALSPSGALVTTPLASTTPTTVATGGGGVSY